MQPSIRPGCPTLGGPAESRLEVIVGACPAQNAAWTNVERALHNLRSAHPLTIAGIRNVRAALWPRCFRNQPGSCGQTAPGTGGVPRPQIQFLYTQEITRLYAGNHPVFVVDARTPRILDRHALLPDDTDCEEILHLFHHAPGSVADREQTNPSTSSARLEAGFLGAARPPQPRARRTPPPSFRFASRWTACPSERASGIARRKPLRARLFAAPISSNSAGCAVHSPQK